MNCCNNNCTQGRDCPARVAKVGRRTPARDPLPRSVWREQLRHLAKWLLIVILLMLMSAAGVGYLHA
jgi:hypothetical protein